VPEPTALTAGAIAAAVSAATMAAFGVDYYSLLYGLVGALLALPHTETMGRARAMLFVVLSTLAGAVIGNAVVSWQQSTSKGFLFLCCLAGGIVAPAAAGLLLKNLQRVVDAAVKRIGGRS
jgi:surface polysaccharide O-acyltransferase-like enzyme